MRAWSACPAAGWDPARCRLDPDVHEISIGVYDGLTREEVPDFDRLAARYEPDDSFPFHWPGGKHRDVTAARLDRALARFDPTADTVVFLHGVSSKLLRGRALGPRPASPQEAFFRLERGVSERLPAWPALLG